MYKNNLHREWKKPIGLNDKNTFQIKKEHVDIQTDVIGSSPTDAFILLYFYSLESVTESVRIVLYTALTTATI